MRRGKTVKRIDLLGEPEVNKHAQESIQEEAKLANSEIAPDKIKRYSLVRSSIHSQ